MLTKANSTKAQRRAAALKQLEMKEQKTTVVATLPSRNQRRRQRKIALAGTLPMYVQNQKGNSVVNPSLAYVDCRLNPWSGMKSTGIPDDSDLPRVVIDHRFLTSFTFGNTGNFNILAMPLFPTPLLANVASASDTTFQINGIHPTYGAGSGLVYYAAGILPEWANLPVTSYNTTGRIDLCPPYLSAAKARLVTMGVRLIFTGSTMADSGFIKINREQFSAGASSENPTAFNVVCFDASTTAYSANQVRTMPINLNPDFTKTLPSSYTGKLKDGSYSVLRHNSPKYDWVDVADNVNYLCRDDDANNAYIVPMVPQGTTIYKQLCPTQFLDDSWSGLSIQITGGTSGQSFNVELICCIEYSPKTSSSVSQLAGQPPVNNRAVTVASDIARNITTDGSQSNDTYEKAVDVAMKVAKTAVGLGSMLL